MAASSEEPKIEPDIDMACESELDRSLKPHVEGALKAAREVAVAQAAQTQSALQGLSQTYGVINARM